MRLYMKLALMALVACSVQALLSSEIAGEAHFALRCLAVKTSGDTTAEAQLVQEWERKLRDAPDHPVTVIACNATAAPR